MKTYNSLELIVKLQEQTENLLNTAIQDWQMLNPSIFKQQPKEASWSAMQCLGHLNAYGDYYLPAIEKAISEKEQKSVTTFTPGLLGNYFTNLMMPNKQGIPPKKMKAPKNYTTNNEGNSDCTIAKFIDQQEKLISLLEKAKSVDLNAIKIPVSIAKFIKLKLGDVFMFLIAHNLRHVKQAERAIAAAKESGSINKNSVAVA